MGIWQYILCDCFFILSRKGFPIFYYDIFYWLWSLYWWSYCIKFIYKVLRLLEAYHELLYQKPELHKFVSRQFKLSKVPSDTYNTLFHQFLFLSGSKYQSTYKHRYCKLCYETTMCWQYSSCTIILIIISPISFLPFRLSITSNKCPDGTKFKFETWLHLILW